MGPRYTCSECGTTLEEGQLMALIGQAPAAGLAAPIGRADKLFDTIGRLYCRDCVRTLGSAVLIRRATQQVQ